VSFPSFMPHKKPFLLLTSDSGFGHRSAANSIAKALMMRHANEAVVSVINPIFDRPTFPLLQKAELNYDRNVMNFPGWYRLAYEISDTRSASTLVESTLTLALYGNIQRLIRDMQPCAIASTNQMFNAPVGAILHFMKHKLPYYTVVTDLADVHSLWFNSKPDRFYVASEWVKSKAIASGISPDKIFISGIPVDPEFGLNDLSREEMRLKLGLNPNLTTLLIVGSRRVSGIPDYLGALEMVSQPFQVVVIAGGDNELYEKLMHRNWGFPIHVKNFVTNVPEWMSCADILVTKAGGLILSEGLAAGLPIILVDYLPGQEEGNVRFILDNQAGAMVETPWRFYCLVDSWLKDNQLLLNAIAMNSRRLGHADSAFVIAEALWQASELDVPHRISNSKYVVVS